MKYVFNGIVIIDIIFIYVLRTTLQNIEDKEDLQNSCGNGSDGCLESCIGLESTTPAILIRQLVAQVLRRAIQTSIYLPTQPTLI